MLTSSNTDNQRRGGAKISRNSPSAILLRPDTVCGAEERIRWAHRATCPSRTRPFRECRRKWLRPRAALVGPAAGRRWRATVRRRARISAPCSRPPGPARRPRLHTARYTATAAARKMLEDGATSIERVGLAVGHEDTAFFRRILEHHSGLSPSAYRSGRRSFRLGRGLCSRSPGPRRGPGEQPSQAWAPDASNRISSTRSSPET